MGWLKGWTFYPNDTKKEILREAAQLNDPDQQNISLVWKDFLECIPTGKNPHADISHGRHATNMALLGNLSAKLGRSIEWNHEKDLIVNDKEANRGLEREYRAPWKYPG